MQITELLQPGGGVVCDLDGVLYRGDVPIEGAAEAVERLRAAGLSLLFCTNNSHPTRAAYARKLGAMGIDIEPRQLLTSAVVTAEVLAARGLSGSCALVIGGPGLREALLEHGVEPLDGKDGAPELVAVGYDPTFDYTAMRAATKALLDGALFVATNDDPSFPAPGGAVWPGTGAILASLSIASGRTPEVMGKPHRPMMDAAAEHLEGSDPIVVVGDRPETDLAGGHAKGWMTVLVLSGVTSRTNVDSVEPKPDVVLEDIGELASHVPTAK